MFLKSLEIRGFKSFADKTELKFDKGVTAVVGPNGSGKSNISDAVRWVLGEQSIKTLRGGKMEDVIFAGTHYRKPVGVAQVSLTLDNYDKELPLDYSDVTITRRIYRSGESEYLINNSQCRLKDITTLFMDTGIGKEGYSLIGQGKIDAILSGKADERRSLLEEAAGIVKFKSRRDESEKKLANTDENLIRINDILSTYEERIEPLEIECIKAEKFINFSNSLKEKEIDLLIYHINNIEKNIKVYAENIYDIEMKNNSLREEIKDKRSKLNIYQNEIEKIDSQTNQERIEYFQGKEKIGELNSEIGILKERITNIEDLIENNNKEKISLLEKSEELKKSKAALLEEISKEKENISKIEEVIQNLDKETSVFLEEISKEEDKVNSLKQQEIDTYKKVAELEKESNIIENSIETIKERIVNLKTDKENLSSSIAINYSTRLMINEKVDKFKEKTEALDKEILQNKNSMTKLQGNLNANEKKYREINIEINRTDATYKMLNNLEKHFEGYNKSVKLLMEHMSKGSISNLSDKCVILGEIISVPKNLETAIEIALGGTISNIITEDEVIAKRLINYLKDNKLGRATFLPLSIIKGKKASINEKITKIQGYIGLASDLIGYDKKYDNAINYSLGRTIITDNMDGALRVAKETSYSYKIVTLTGEIVNPGGALTGGNYGGKNSSIISRKRELEELKIRYASLEEESEKLKTELVSLRENLKKLDEDNLNKRDQIHFNNIEIAKLQNEIKNIQNEELKLQSSIEDIEVKYQGLIKEQLELNDNFKVIKEIIIKTSESKEDNKVLIKSIEENLKDAKASITENRDKITDNRIKKASLEEFISGKLRELNRLEEEQNSCVNRVSEIETSIKNGIATKKISNEDIEKHTKEIENLRSLVEKFEEIWKQSEIKRISIKENMNKVQTEVDELNQILQKSENEYHKLEMGKAKYDIEKENYYNRLNEEFSLTYAEAFEKANDVINEVDHKREITTLKSQITALGVVNVGAIEEYKEVKEKYTFMSSQKEDLEKAKEDLLEVISDMTSKMKEVFIENFKILNGYFSETFRELFKGGSAELILGEGDELTSNIEINVQPPGKKVQNINLMSGGEKVLSAIALLFGILKMKPTPFCILDEIEAALDDANVYRYAEFLRKFSENIQFIVVTHRKGTMEASDIMYGVTMEEKGISKIVSVNLQGR